MVLNPTPRWAGGGRTAGVGVQVHIFIFVHMFTGEKFRATDNQDAWVQTQIMHKIFPRICALGSSHQSTLSVSPWHLHVLYFGSTYYANAYLHVRFC